MIIELLAAQLRSNPNIVGFTVEGETIISLHYADDTTITITQNRCFKEVIKDDTSFKEVINELRRYEDATGAKINFQKTQGLWAGNVGLPILVIVPSGSNGLLAMSSI